jgi:prolyl oligopeptidase
MTYPTTRKADQVDTYHGVPVADPYRWLEDDRSPETADWVRAQNEITFDYLHGLPEREKFRARLTELWNYPRHSAPSRYGSRYFYFRNNGLQNQAVLYVQESLDGEARILLDPNVLSPDGTVALSNIALTDDGGKIAYSISESGSDWQDVKVRDVATGEDLPDIVRWVKFSLIAWTADGAGFFYSRYPAPDNGEDSREAHRDHTLYYHRLGTDQEADPKIYAHPTLDDCRIIGTVSEDGRYLFIVVSRSGEQNLLSIVDLADPMHPALDAPVTPLVERFEAHYWPVANDGPVIYLETDLDAPRRRVAAIDVSVPDPMKTLRTVVPQGEDVIGSVLLVGNRFVISYLHNAYSRVALFGKGGEYVGDLPLPTLGTVGEINGRRGDTEIFYSFTSFLYPTTAFRVDMLTGAQSVYRSPEISFDPNEYETRQVWYTSRDGTQVPMFITHRKGMELDGNNPTILYGYGGFNVSLTPFFSASNLLWLENGGIFAIANLRGGGEFGEEWHRGGTLDRKQNVFDDFIAAAEYLIANGYTSSRKLALQGGSNGGLLVGAVMCQRPDLFAVALPAVGVMDMLRYHNFTIGSAWASDYGISDDPEHFRNLFVYSPLHNLKPGTSYPATLITTADHDDRVVPGHSFKFAARLQECHAGDRPVLIRVETNAGHGSGKPIAMLIEETADVLAFAMANM